MPQKFPQLIHVTKEGEGDGAYWQVHEHGIVEVEEAGKPVAIYQLVKVGSVRIEKSFVESRDQKRQK